MHSTLGNLLRSRAVLFDLGDEKGGASAERLAGFLTDRKIPVMERTVESWFLGERRPRQGRMERVLDALGVHGDDRLEAYRLAARVGIADPIPGSADDDEEPAASSVLAP